ncbi:MAG: ABC transporter permease [Kofleriaceae bacterium]
MIAALFTTAFLAQIVRIAVPYVFAALGGSLTERSGVIDLALEAKLLFGAFTAAALAHATGSAVVGVAGGMAAGALTAMVQLGCALWLEADQVIVGVALNLLALGGTRFLLQLIYHEGANSPPTPAFGDRVVSNPLVIGAVLAAVLVPLAVKHTRWGLRLRAAGDRPDALVAVGVSPRRTRMLAALVGGALAGAGGAQLSLAVGGFSADMSSGRGYIALAMIILAGWRPALAALACVAVAFAEGLNILIQITHATVLGHRIPSELAPLLPYVLTVVVLALYNDRSRRPPASLGKL